MTPTELKRHITQVCNITTDEQLIRDAAELAVDGDPLRALNLLRTQGVLAPDEADELYDRMWAAADFAREGKS